MANEKFLYVDPATGQYTEAPSAAQTFAGSGSANRLVQTDASGKIDNSLVNFAAFDKVFAVRAASSTNLDLSAPGASIGAVTMASGERFLAYGQTAPAENGIYVFNGAASPATRAPDYNEDSEVEAGDLVVVSEGTFAERIYILATNAPIVVGTSALTYAPLGTSLIDAGSGLSYSGTTLNVNLLSGRGLEFVGDDIAVNPSDIAGLGTIEVANQLAIDFVVSGTNNNSDRAVKGSDLINFGANQGSKIIGYDNTATSAYTAATTAQQAIDDVYSLAAAPGVSYTAGLGGVAKGDLVYISASNTVLPYADSSSTSRKAIGLAATAASAGNPVKVISDSTVLTAVLSGATPGTTQYWTGSGFSASIPSGNGAYVWAVGTAKSATELHAEVNFLKRNSSV